MSQHDRSFSVGPAPRPARRRRPDQRFADRPGLLGAVQNADRAHHRRQRLEDALVGNGRYSRTCTTPTRSPRSTRAATVWPAQLLKRRTHRHQHSLRLRVSGVVDDVHLAAGALAKAGHQVLDHARNPRVERVHRFTRLEVDVRVLCGAANEGALGRQRPSAMRPHQLLGHQRPQVVVRERLNRVEFVRGSKPVEEVHERYPGRQCGRLRDKCQVVCLLH